MKTNEQIMLEAMASRIRELEDKIESQEVYFNEKLCHEGNVTSVLQYFIGEKHPSLSKELTDFALELCTKNPYDYTNPFKVGADALNFETDVRSENKHLESGFHKMIALKNNAND
jgi:hypothetical protein